jgi:hypothetical protein
MGPEIYPQHPKRAFNRTLKRALNRTFNAPSNAPSNRADIVMSSTYRAMMEMAVLAPRVVSIGV